MTYLRISALGIPAMLVVLATTGVLRGLQDTRTPLVAAVGGFGLNIVLNVWFVHGLHWGIAGSAWGTVIAQTLHGRAPSSWCSCGTPRARRCRCAPTPGGSSPPPAGASRCSCAPSPCAPCSS